MRWNPFRKEKAEPERDPLSDLTLSDLKPGYLLDYDLKTWSVTAQNRYDFEGDRVDEWQLHSGGEVRYLEREEDDSVAWTLSRKVSLSDIDPGLNDHMKRNDDPPESIPFDGIDYEGTSTAVGKFYKDGEGSGQEFIVWDYADASGHHSLTLEQWGEHKYEASVGECVHEYQFSHILPSD